MLQVCLFNPLPLYCDLNIIFTEEKMACSDEGVLSKECGAKYLKASPTCCDGLVCQGKRCVSQ